MEEMEMFGGKRANLDALAKKGLFKQGDEPGTDTYDDGSDEKGNVVMPGSTSTEAGGMYMEDQGPNDLRRRGAEGDASRAEQAGLTVADEDELLPKKDLYSGNDAAAKWLRENDPNFKGRDDSEMREAA